MKECEFRKHPVDDASVIVDLLFVVSLSNLIQVCTLMEGLNLCWRLRSVPDKNYVQVCAPVHVPNSESFVVVFVVLLGLACAYLIGERHDYFYPSVDHHLSNPTLATCNVAESEQLALASPCRPHPPTSPTTAHCARHALESLLQVVLAQPPDVLLAVT